MDKLLPSLIVIAISAAVLLVVLGVIDLRNYAFVIKIVDGRAMVSRGKVKSEFLDAVAEVCSEHGVRSGWVGGVRSGRRLIRLVFSRTIPRPCRQRLRNTWGITV